MSDQVSWISCPRCRNRAAVGWAGGQLVEFDCLSGCQLTQPEFHQALVESLVLVKRPRLVGCMP